MNKRYITDKQIHTAVLDIVSQMYSDEWRPDYIVRVTRGGLYPAVLMSHYTGIKMHTLDVRLRDDDIQQTCTWMADDAYGIFQQGGEYEAKNILILDDINDTGATFQWIKDDWEKAHFLDNARPMERWQEVWHKNVRFAVITNNLPSPFEVDYYGMEINKEDDPSWIVFPHEGWWQI